MTTSIALEDLDWGHDAQTAIEHMAETGADFTAYDLEQAGLRQPPTPNMWGPAFRAAAHSGIITDAGYRRSLRPGRRGSRCLVWVGTRNA